MIFIEHFEHAKNYHQKVLNCWFIHKLYKKSDLKKVEYECDLLNCECCKEINEHGAYKERKYYEYLNEPIREFLKENLENIFTNDFSKLKEFYQSNILLISRNENELKKFIIESTYTDFFQKKCGRKFLNLLNINTCLSCNINYTLEVTKSHSRAQLDHFLPKTHFPILGVNFYNLIPVCARCNHLKGSGKSKKWWFTNYNKIYHPYFKEEEIFKFNFSFSKTKNEFEIEFIKSSIKDFKTIEVNRLHDIYSAHRDFELRDLYNLRIKYNENYLDQVLSFFEKNGLTRSECYEMIFGISVDEKKYSKRPFSKFKSDIIEELLKIK
ncbi:hypothetical protein [Flavobacterium sp. JP2137]|uniref:hypothetical protein n=1 Tax=Flavobacterium sp. JP2137 TaxID=3414510 RepID=UPI003D3001D0